MSPFKHDWTDYDKRGAGNWRYAKYDSVLKVIVSEPQEGNKKGPSTIYLSALAMELLGNPAYIRVVKDGDIVGFIAAEEGDPRAYIVARAMKVVEADNSSNNSNGKSKPPEKSSKPKFADKRFREEVKKEEEHGAATTGRPFISARSIIKKWELRPGAYDAYKDINGATVIVYFNTKSEPSTS